MNTYPLRKTQSGISLLESLIAILIFSVGILAIVALQAAAIKGTTESKLRADAAYLANQIVARMWIANRVKPASANYISTFAHFPAGPICAPTGAASANSSVTAWLNDVAVTLPGATPATQQIVVGAGNLVTVSLCWRVGTDQRQLSVTAQLNG